MANKNVEETPQIIITNLGNGILRLSAPEGYKLYNSKAQQCYANGSTIRESDLMYWSLVPALE